jgi:hypothetical protein
MCMQASNAGSQEPRNPRNQLMPKNILTHELAESELRHQRVGQRISAAQQRGAALQQTCVWIEVLF